MYTIVLMAALSGASTETPGWGHWHCHGCHGGWSCHGGCHGCWSCHGGCYGGYAYGCYGCYCGYAYSCYGCYGGYSYGCCGGYSYGCGGCWASSPYHVVPVAPGVPAKPAELAPPPKAAPGAAAANKARVVVELPDDAKLYFDNQLMKTTNGRRVFNTPTLEAGQAYYYILKAEIEIDGKTHTETKQLIVRPGQVAETRFVELLALKNGPKTPPVAVAGVR